MGSFPETLIDPFLGGSIFLSSPTKVAGGHAQNIPGRWPQDLNDSPEKG